MRAVAELSRRTYIDTDLESLLEPFPGWDTEWIHLGPGSSSLQGARFVSGAGTISSLQTSSAGILRGAVASDGLALICSRSSADSVRSYARVIGGDVCLVLGPAAALDLYLPAGSSVMIVAMSRIAMVANSHAAEVAQARHCTLDPALGALLPRSMEALEQIRVAPASSRDAQRRLREHLPDLTATLARESAGRLQTDRAQLQRHLAVIRACAYVDANLRTPIALLDLCIAAGVSTRALEYGFRDFYGMGPMAYVRNLRLCRVRHDLQDPDGSELSVSGAARRWSFTHMGQFSHDYRALFGEMPSMTLAAHQRAAKATGPVS